MESQGAVLLAKLLSQVHKEFSQFIKVSSIYCYSDSMVVLHWISGNGICPKTFAMGRRADKIQKLVVVDC